MRRSGRWGAAAVAVVLLAGCGSAPSTSAHRSLEPTTPPAATRTPGEATTVHAGPATTVPVRTAAIPRVPPDVPLGSLRHAPGASARSIAGAVALTFDDGPDAAWTPSVLAILARYHAHATFFDIGENVSRDPALARAEYAAGDGVGNHTETHPDLAVLDAAGVAAQIAQAAAAIREATGHAPICLRPPYDAIDAQVDEVTAQQHEALMLYDIDPKDWTRPGVAVIVARVLAGVRPGAVIDLHDAGGDRSETVAALPLILQGLAARHLVPVTLCRA